MSIPNAFKPTFGPLFRSQAVWERLRVQTESPHRLALGFAVGAVLGLSPLLWGSSLLGIALAWRLRLNLLAVQVGNCASYPLHVALFVPFLWVGQKLLPDTLQTLSLSAWPVVLAAGPRSFLHSFWQANLGALIVWLLSSPLWLGIFYLGLRGVLKATSRASARIGADSCRNPNKS